MKYTQSELADVVKEALNKSKGELLSFQEIVDYATFKLDNLVSTDDVECAIWDVVKLGYPIVGNVTSGYEITSNTHKIRLALRALSEEGFAYKTQAEQARQSGNGAEAYLALMTKAGVIFTHERWLREAAKDYRSGDQCPKASR